MSDPNAVVIDVRNFNETLIGRFAPDLTGGAAVLNPAMRRSTEFPAWVAQHEEELRGKRVLMYCTGGVRCERASAYVRTKLGMDADVSQLAGGIHRYLEAYSEDGGHW
jgi:predicted sulfurtransferase